MQAKFTGGPGHKQTREVDEPPARRYLWPETAMLQVVPEGGRYPAEARELHRYDLQQYDPAQGHPEPRAHYAYGGKIPDHDQAAAVDGFAADLWSAAADAAVKGGDEPPQDGWDECADDVKRHYRGLASGILRARAEAQPQARFT